jgi:hypothetical protein
MNLWVKEKKMSKYMSIEIWECCEYSGCRNGATHEVFQIDEPEAHAPKYVGRYCPGHTSDYVESSVIPERFIY